ncbi:MAG: hypothetical protein CL846_09560 [Crocinitomicaceae bacterium]|nr:hypothetical protein [Crocinitomicaceae bacterium]|tara:strand:- start:1607 stop:3238 length:1632 start_codon:yes stop_codon:yes gene_type:complete
MVKKIKIFIVIICLSIISFTLLDRNFFIVITSPFRKEIQSKVSKLNIPKLKLVLNDEVCEHFNQLYKDYVLEENHTKEYFEFLKYYKEHNLWKSASLIFEDKSYAIKIKSHGKTPSNHKERDFISFSIKLENNELIRGANRFNLIIYWRVKEFDYPVYSSIAKDMGVLYQKTDLVSVTINNKPSKLYYFEYRLNKDYLKEYKPTGLVALKRKDNKSMLFFDDDLDSLSTEIEMELMGEEYNFLKPIEKESIYNNFSLINECLAKDDYNLIYHFFDLDYIAKVLALKTISGTNDGFEKCNFIAPFSLKDSNFYPFVHRDCMIKPINDVDEIEFANEHYKLIRALNRNDSIRIRKYQILYDYISKTNLDSLQLKIDIIQKFHETLYYSSWIKYHIGLNEKIPVVNNIKKIKGFIESSNPKLKFKNTKQGFQIELRPNSYSPISFSSFKLENLKAIDQIQLTVFEKNTSLEIFKNSLFKSGNDIIELFEQLDFYCGLTDEMSKENNIYILDFKIKLNSDILDNKINVDISMKNKISNKEILSVNYN